MSEKQNDKINGNCVVHEEIKAFESSCTTNFLSKTGSVTTCVWTIYGDLYSKSTSYLVSIVSNAQERLSLYTLGIQLRIAPEIESTSKFKDNLVKIVGGDKVVFEKIKDGGHGTECIKIDGNETKIPPCGLKGEKGGKGRMPANPDGVCFLKFSEVSERIKSCTLIVTSARINHREDDGDCDDVHREAFLNGHDDLPPQPQAGGNN